MPLPHFNNAGDLPLGVHQASLDEVIERFGSHTPRRREVAARLLRIFTLARATGKLDSMVIFGSFITAKLAPNDVDILLVMRDDFNWNTCAGEERMPFHHSQAAAEFGASVFWIRPSMLILETLDEFVSHWQIKRGGARRGIVEVKA